MVKPLFGGMLFFALVASIPAMTSSASTQHNPPNTDTDTDTVQWQREHAAYERDVAYADLYHDRGSNNIAFESSLIEAMYHLRLARVDTLSTHDVLSTRAELERTHQYLHTAENSANGLARERLLGLEDRFQNQFGPYMQGKTCTDIDPKAFSKLNAAFAKTMNNSST